MRVVVVGAHGRTGIKIVEQLIAAGDGVVATIRDPRQMADMVKRGAETVILDLEASTGPDFATQFNAWSGGALGPAHTLRQSAFFRPGNASRRVDGLFYAGCSTIPGIGLPMCLISAELVVKRLRDDTGTGRLPEPLRAASPEPVG